MLIVALSDWCNQQSFGLVYWSNAGIGLTILIGVLALDFSSWHSALGDASTKNFMALSYNTPQ